MNQDKIGEFNLALVNIKQQLLNLKKNIEDEVNEPLGNEQMDFFVQNEAYYSKLDKYDGLIRHIDRFILKADKVLQ